MPLAPPLLELQQIVEQVMARAPVDAETVESRFGRAREFLFESVGLFREVEATLSVDEQGQQKLALCSQEIEHSLQALDRLQEAVRDGKMFILKERLESFIGSRERCLEYFAEFSRLAQQQPIYSPVPAYDAFIKAGIKVIEGKLERSRLEERFPALLPELHRVQRLVALLPKLHQPPSALIQALKSGLQGLESGYGAVDEYLRTGEQVALEDGLKLIGSSSTVLDQQLQKAEEVAGASPRFSTFRPLEEWLRLKEYMARTGDPEVEPAWVVAGVTQIFFVWDYMLGQAEGLLANPMLDGVEVEGGLTPALFQEVMRVRAEADEQLSRLPESLLESEDTFWIGLATPLQQLQDALAASLQALEGQLAPFKELPGLERLVYVKDEVKRGVSPPSALQAELRDGLARVEELIDSVRHGQDPISRELHDLLPIHRGAFIGMIENLEQDDWEGLEARWQGVLSTLPHLATLSRTLRQRLEAQSSSSRQIKCLRCQASNSPERRVCGSCGANLPTVIQKAQTFSEISTEAGGGGGATVSVSPRAIELLESLVRALEGNQTTKKDAAEALQLLINDLNRQRQMFTKKLVPMMGKEPTLDTYLRVFAQVLNSYFGSLMEMHQAVEEGQLARLHSGLAQCRETLEAMDLMKERIDEALRG